MQERGLLEWHCARLEEHRRTSSLHRLDVSDGCSVGGHRRGGPRVSPQSTRRTRHGLGFAREARTVSRARLDPERAERDASRGGRLLNFV